MDPLQRARSFGWWSLLVWLSLGMVLEGLHGFKVGWYLDVANEARRLMFTLAHSHGTLLALVNLAFATTLRPADGNAVRMARSASCLQWAAVLMPLGFLGGGVQIYGADPGFAIILVPVGGFLLITGVLGAARMATVAQPVPPAPPASGGDKKPPPAKGK